MKRYTAAMLVLLCHCGGSDGGTATSDNGPSTGDDAGDTDAAMPSPNADAGGTVDTGAAMEPDGASMMPDAAPDGASAVDAGIDSGIDCKALAGCGSTYQCGPTTYRCNGAVVDCGGCDPVYNMCGDNNVPNQCSHVCLDNQVDQCIQAEGILGFQPTWGTMAGCVQPYRCHNGNCNQGYDLRPNGNAGCMDVGVNGSWYTCCP